jgi:hypothetical protein
MGSRRERLVKWRLDRLGRACLPPASAPDGLDDPAFAPGFEIVIEDGPPRPVRTYHEARRRHGLGHDPRHAVTDDHGHHPERADVIPIRHLWTPGDPGAPPVDGWHIHDDDPPAV